jgi:hypothetical protein
MAWRNNVANARAVAVQDQDQDQDQNVRSIFRNIGNNTVNIDVDNDNVLVAVLVLLGGLNGTIATDELRAYIDKIVTKKA